MAKRLRRYTIYALSDPISKEIRYIGKSSIGLERAKSHTLPSTLKKGNTHCCTWIKSLISLGLKPIIEEVEVHQNHDDLIQAEIFYISYFRSLGFNLTNHTYGGEGSVGRKYTMPKETKIKIGNSNRGKIRTPEWRNNMSLSKKGHKYSDEIRLKNCRAHGGDRIIDEKGHIYNSVRDASRKLGISSPTISALLKNERPNSKMGKTFKYLKKDANGLQ